MTSLAVSPDISYRQATDEDVPALVYMLREFVTSTKYRKFVGDSIDALQVFLQGLMTNEAAGVFVAERDGKVIGMIALLRYIHPMSGEKVAGELFWWLDPAHRGAGGWLLRRAESWARGWGAKSLQMIAPSDSPHVGEMYRRLGYEAVETMWHLTFKEHP